MPAPFTDFHRGMSWSRTLVTIGSHCQVNKVKMCVDVQPICNACSTTALPVEVHECIFAPCKYPEKRTRLLSRQELLKWDCSTPGCGLSVKTFNDKLDEIDRILRMEADLPLRPAEGDSLPSREDVGATSRINPQTGDEALDAIDTRKMLPTNRKVVPPAGFDGDSTSIAHARRDTTELKVTSHGNVSRNNSVAANDNVPTSDSSAVDEHVTASDNSVINENLAADENPATSGNPAISDNVAINNANDSLATNDHVAADSSVETVFDPDSVDLATFPRCRHCFLSRRRCNGQTPCDKCRQRRCPRACRPVTVELLRQHHARAERVLELARRNGASSSKWEGR